METSTLEVTARLLKGKQDSKKLRRDGVIPAVFYGPGQESVSLIVDPKKLMEAIDTDAGENTLLTLSVQGNKNLDKKVVILKNRQINPLTREIIHADFYEIAMDKVIEVEIPVVLKGKAKGLEDGGTLQVVRKEILVECLPNAIPEKIEIDVTALEIGDNIHIKDIVPPEGVKFIYETNFTVVNMAAPQKEEVKVEEVAAAVEGAEAAPATGDAKAEPKKDEKSPDKAEKKAPDKKAPEKK